MQYIEFRKSFQNYILFSKKDIEKRWPKFNKMNLIYWQKKDYIYKIRNSWYCFSDIIDNEKVNLFIANKIYNPSYISRETALHYYGFIPEGVFLTTSVSTLKTKEFNTFLGIFSYNTIKSSCFFAYTLIKIDNITIRMAEPEKALLDFLYFKKSIYTIDDIKSYRFNKDAIKEIVDFEKIEAYVAMFKTKVLREKLNLLKQYVNA